MALMQTLVGLQILLLFHVLGTTEYIAAQPIGVCYGTVADNLPPPKEVVDLYEANGIEKMRIYNPDPSIMEALKGSNIELVVGVPNEDIQTLATSEPSAIQWVQNNIKTHINYVKFRYIVVGNEIMPNDQQAQFMFRAMQNIYAALVSFKLHTKIKVSTAIKLSVLGSSYPPSQGSFSPSSYSYIKPIISFLADKDAPLLVNLYTYFTYIGDPNDINLDFALFSPSNTTIKDGKYEYHNLFDASLDAVYAALEKLDAPNLQVVVSESGWPSDGGSAATVLNAKLYYQNLVQHVTQGTPKRPNQALETYLFAMFDEDLKGPAETERHFGLFHPNKNLKYQISFTSCSSESDVPNSSALSMKNNVLPSSFTAHVVIVAYPVTIVVEPVATFLLSPADSLFSRLIT
ncbi:Glucan endo-1,3-beta-glucosidase [Arachis hypogaea]|nr:Glucan endo-1,3-beta-glucosidase [Arachis hypogaea]